MACSICGISKVRARGLCHNHYYFLRNHGELHKHKTKVESGTRKQDLEQRLMSKVEKDRGGCWNWIGALHKFGYGMINMHPKVQRAHRVSYEYFIGPIPKGKLLRHSCDNKRCVNPAHLLPGTKRDNGRDSVERGQFRPNNKLEPEQIIKIRVDQRTHTAIALDYGVCQTTISRIKNGTRWAKLWAVD